MTRRIALASLVIAFSRWPLPVAAQPVQLFVSVLCPPGPQPGGCRLAVVTAGQVLAVQVQVNDPNYVGTIRFSSSDPLADLPPAYTFVPADRGLKGFSAVLRTPGTQTITATDTTGSASPGTDALTVLAGQAIPMTSAAAAGLLAILLAFCGVLVLRQAA
jgi:hypothetical protein